MEKEVDMQNSISQSFRPIASAAYLEFFKLDYIDRKVARWVSRKDPKSLLYYLKYTAFGYIEKGVELNVERIYSELALNRTSRVTHYDLKFFIRQQSSPADAVSAM